MVVPYSPAEAQWPGWQFYASVNFSPMGGIWHDLEGYNAYVARCQSIAQSGTQDNEILLYFPMADFWQTVGEKPYMTFTVHNDWMDGSKFFTAAEKLLDNGWAFDYVSDEYLAKAEVKDGNIVINSHEYKTIVIPETELMPLDTISKLKDMADAGVNIIFENKVPHDMPGLNIDKKDKKEFQHNHRVLKNALILSNIPRKVYTGEIP